MPKPVKFIPINVSVINKLYYNNQFAHAHAVLHFTPLLFDSIICLNNIILWYSDKRPWYITFYGGHFFSRLAH